VAHSINPGAVDHASLDPNHASNVAAHEQALTKHMRASATRGDYLEALEAASQRTHSQKSAIW
jgi:hypothetical protein